MVDERLESVFNLIFWPSLKDTPPKFKSMRCFVSEANSSIALQELLAPNEVKFFSRTWTLLGTKLGLQSRISSITHIDEEYLNAMAPLDSASVAKRMSWASSRTTTVGTPRGGGV